MTPDFNRFFEQVTVYIFCQRLQIVFDIASDEVLAARVFKAFSATARLRVIKAVLSWRVDEPLIVKPSGDA